MRPSRTACWRLLTVVCCCALSTTRGDAHEGHAVLPASGAVVTGNELRLTKAARDAIGLRTAKVRLATMRSQVSANGRIEVPWKQHAFATTLITGVVQEVYVQVGDVVRKAQPLARIRSLELEQLQLDLVSAATDLDYYTDLYGRQEKLHESGAISGGRLLETGRLREEAALRSQIASAKLRALGLKAETLDALRAGGDVIDWLEIQSPIAGTVAHAEIRIGQSVDRDEHLFHIIDDSLVWCVADVLESDCSEIRLGQTTLVDVGASRGDTRRAQVDHIDVSVDPNAHTLRVVAELDNPEGLLKPGMSARTSIRVAEAPEAIVCSRNALLGPPGGFYVLLKRGRDKYIRRPVQVGRVDREKFEVRRGLFPGDRVITVGAHLLSSLFGDPQRSPAKKLRAKKRRDSADRKTFFAAVGVVELPTQGKFFATSRVSGRLTKIFVEHGQTVEAGLPLAELESLDLFDLQLELVELDVRRRWSLKLLESLDPVRNQGGSVVAEARKARAELRKLEHQVRVVRRRLTESGLDDTKLSRLLRADLLKSDLFELVDRTVTILAPKTGRIAHFDLTPGYVVRAHDHQLFEIHDPTVAWVKAYLFERHLREVDVGRTANVRFAANGTWRSTGTVAKIAGTREDTHQVYPVWITLKNPPKVLREGMMTRLEFTGHGQVELGKRPQTVRR